MSFPHVHPRLVPGALATVRRELAQQRVELKLCQRWAEEREAELAMQADGKNAELRKAALVLLCREDADLAEKRRGIADAEQRIAELEAEEAYLQDVRRSWEWGVRLQMAAALSGKSIASDGNDPDAQDALDNVLTEPPMWRMPEADLPDSLPPLRPEPVQVPVTVQRAMAERRRPSADDEMAELYPPRPTGRRNQPQPVEADDDVPF
jgi:hypothetical protein